MQDRVIILWMSSGDVADLFALSYANNQARSYHRDHYDARLVRENASRLPYFDNAVEAVAWMYANPGSQCQVAVGDATRRLGFTRHDIADVSTLGCV